MRSSTKTNQPVVRSNPEGLVTNESFALIASQYFK